MVDTNTGITLVGEAARSWVLLQWIDSIQVWIFVWGFIYVCYRVVKSIMREESENE